MAEGNHDRWRNIVRIGLVVLGAVMLGACAHLPESYPAHLTDTPPPTPHDPFALDHDPGSEMGRIDLAQRALHNASIQNGHDSFCFMSLIRKVNALQVLFDTKAAQVHAALNAPGANVVDIIKGSDAELHNLRDQIDQTMLEATASAYGTSPGLCT